MKSTEELESLNARFPEVSFQPDDTWEGVKNRFSEIEDEFQQYLEKDKQNLLDVEQRQILRDLCNKIGRYFTRVLYKADRGIDLYIHALDIEKALNEPKRKIAKSLCGLGNAYVDNGQNEKAISYYKEACELLEDAQKEYSEDSAEAAKSISVELAAVYHHLGSAYYGMGLQDALECYERERALLVELYGENDFKNYIRIVGLKINIGNVERDINENSNVALELFTSVIDWIEINNRSAQPPAFLFTAYRARGKAQIFLGSIDRALEDFEKAEKIYLSLNVNTAHSHMFYILDGKADALFSSGRIEDAAKVYRRALEINMALHEDKPNGHPDLATSFRKMGKLAIHNGEYGEAEELLSKAFVMYTKTLYPGHFDIKATEAEVAELKRLRDNRKNPLK